MQKKEDVNQDTTTKHKKPFQSKLAEKEPCGHSKAYGSEFSSGLPSAHSATCMPPPKGWGWGILEAKTGIGGTQ